MRGMRADSQEFENVSSARLASIQDRREDVLSFPASNGGRVSVRALLLCQTLLLIPEVRQYQLSLQPRGLLARVVLRKGTPKAAALALVRCAIETELDHLGATVDMFSVEAVDEIRTRL